jgi:heat shock protein HtpX
MNNIKTLFLLVVLTLVLVWAGGAFGGKNGMTIALIIALGLNLFAYWFSDKLVLRMYGAKQVTEADAPELYGIVRRLSQKAQMPMPKVYMIEGDQPNAFATGRNPKHAAVAVTSGIMRILNRDELTGVIGHELAHISHRDILISTIAATIAGAISYLAQMAQWAAIFGNRSDDEEGGSPVAALVMMIVGPIAALIISRWQSHGQGSTLPMKAAHGLQAIQDTFQAP